MIACTKIVFYSCTIMYRFGNPNDSLRKYFPKVQSITGISRTEATGSNAGGDGSANNDNTLRGDDDGVATNTVEGRNREYINNFIAVGDPTCSTT